MNMKPIQYTVPTTGGKTILYHLFEVIKHTERQFDLQRDEQPDLVVIAQDLLDKVWTLYYIDWGTFWVHKVSDTNITIMVDESQIDMVDKMLTTIHPGSVDYLL